jgi:hypothetical protein
MFSLKKEITYKCRLQQNRNLSHMRLEIYQIVLAVSERSRSLNWTRLVMPYLVGLQITTCFLRIWPLLFSGLTVISDPYNLIYF